MNRRKIPHLRFIADQFFRQKFPPFKWNADSGLLLIVFDINAQFHLIGIRFIPLRIVKHFTEAECIVADAVHVFMKFCNIICDIFNGFCLTQVNGHIVKLRCPVLLRLQLIVFALLFQNDLFARFCHASAGFSRQNLRLKTNFIDFFPILGFLIFCDQLHRLLSHFLERHTHCRDRRRKGKCLQQSIVPTDTDIFRHTDSPLDQLAYHRQCHMVIRTHNHFRHLVFRQKPVTRLSSHIVPIVSIKHLMFCYRKFVFFHRI